VCAACNALSQKELYKALGVHGPEFHLNFSKFPPFFWAAVPDRICLTLSPQLKSISKWVHKKRKNLKFMLVKIYVAPQDFREKRVVVVDRDTLKSCRHCRHHILRFPVVCHLATRSKVEIYLSILSSA
jgi:hypothetical protein